MWNLNLDLSRTGRLIRKSPLSALAVFRGDFHSLKESERAFFHTARKACALYVAEVTA